MPALPRPAAVRGSAAGWGLQLVYQQRQSWQGHDCHSCAACLHCQRLLQHSSVTNSEQRYLPSAAFEPTVCPGLLTFCTRLEYDIQGSLSCARPAKSISLLGLSIRRTIKMHVSQSQVQGRALLLGRPQRNRHPRNRHCRPGRRLPCSAAFNSNSNSGQADVWAELQSYQGAMLLTLHPICRLQVYLGRILSGPRLCRQVEMGHLQSELAQPFSKRMELYSAKQRP